MKPVDIKPNTYINSSKEITYQDPKFKVGDNIRISKYNNSFAKEYIPNLCEQVFVITKVKNTAPWIYILLVLLKEKKMLEPFTKKNWKKKFKKSLELKK